MCLRERNMVKLMGEKYNLTEDELEQMRSLLISAISFTVGNIFELYMALVWLYEYMEIWAVNNTNLNANKRVVSNFFNVEPTLVTALFRLRGAIVHRPCDVLKYFNLLINFIFILFIIATYHFRKFSYFIRKSFIVF